MNHISPPAWPLKLLRFFLKKDYLEEIEGDMEELFRDNAEQLSHNRARIIYTWEMLRLLRPILMKNFEGAQHINPYPMFKNYFKTSVRALMKNPLSSFINVFGLSVAIGICLVVYTFLEYDRSIDQFHKNKNEVYLVTFFADRDGTMQHYGTTPRPLGDMLKQDFDQIKKVCRIEDKPVVLKQEDNVFHEHVRFADAEFLEMFTFPLKWGTANSLNDLNSIILSEEMSVKYFGEENPIGRDMLMIFNDQTKKSFTVTGVAAAFPKARAIDFNFLINYENTRAADPRYDFNDWKAFLNATLIQVDNPSDLKSIGQGMKKYRSLQNEVQHDWAIASFAFEPLATLFENSSGIKNCISQDYNVEGRIGMPIIAIFMLALACFNYINIAIVSAAKRLKEIGIRKVIGANRARVIVQFLAENIVVTFFALIMGLILGVLIFIPWFVQFTGWPLETKLWDGNLWIFLLVLLLFTGIASGIYPAFYISKFEATRIFKGSLEFGRKNPLTKVFLGIQLILACITITAGVVFTQNNSYQRNRSWGYNQREALYVNVPDQSAFNNLSAIVTQDPNVLSISGSVDHLGKNVSTAVLHMPPNRQYEVSQLSVDAHYFETMGLDLIKGRGFKEFAESDKQAVVINELLVQNLNLVEPIGHQFEIDSIRYEVIGVLKDFHHDSFFNKVQPTIFKVAPEKDYHYLSLRVKSGAEAKMYATLQSRWGKLYPEIPFQGGHQEDVWSGYFESLDKSVAFNRIIAFIAVMLASLGLYGLVTLNVAGRVREFSIRKTLGAGLHHIASSIIKQYVLLTTIALLIGAPISYLFTKAYLNMLFSYSMPMGYSGVIMAVMILMIVLLAVVSTQIRKVSKSNPVDGLKME
jgi:ABC-type antimicrobial peptide transport system permease subunit